jgi:hypothetical protein
MMDIGSFVRVNDEIFVSVVFDPFGDAMRKA